MTDNQFHQIDNLEKTNKIKSEQIKLIEIPFKRKKRTIINGCFDLELLKKIRKKLGCGGTLSKNGLELQGNFYTNNKLKKLLQQENILEN